MTLQNVDDLRVIDLLMKADNGENTEAIRDAALELGLIYDPFDPLLPCWQEEA